MKITLELDLERILRWLLAAIFLWAAVSKLANVQDFHASLVAYRLPLPDGLLRLISVVLPWLELLCGFLLLTRTALGAALLWSAVLCGAFVLATGQAWMRGLEISCGCLNLSLFGLGDGATKFLQSPGFAFFRALLLTAASVWLLRRFLAAKATPPAPEASPASAAGI